MNRLLGMNSARADHEAEVARLKVKIARLQVSLDDAEDRNDDLQSLLEGARGEIKDLEYAYGAALRDLVVKGKG